MDLICKFERPRRFFLHYNKVLSKQKKKPHMSLHVSNKCHMIPAGRLKIHTFTEDKVNKRQPFVVIQGKTKEIFRDSEGNYHVR